MCGIVLVAGQLSSADARVFDKMFFLNELRGAHSSGLATICPNSGQTTILKTTNPSSQFIKQEDYNKARSISDCMFIGHSRHATLGEKNEENAHPFEFESLVGVHNGTLEYNSKSALSQNKRFGTDSEAFFYAVDSKGLDWALARTYGDFAFVWYDKNNHQLKIIRNDKRPLTFVFTKDAKELFISSNPTFIRLAMENERYGKELKTSSEGHVWSFLPNCLYTLDLPDNYYDSLEPFNVEKKDKIIGSESVRPSYHGGYFPWKSEKEKKEKEVITQIPMFPARGQTSSIVPTSSSAFTNISTNKLNLHELKREIKISTAYMNFFRSEAKKKESLDYKKHIISQVPSDDKRVQEMKNKLKNLCISIPQQQNLVSGHTVPLKAHKKLLGMYESAETIRDILEEYDRINAKRIEMMRKPLYVKGFPSLSEKEFKMLVQNKSCCICGGQNIDWASEDCIELTSGDYICPDCEYTEVAQECFREGMIRCVN